MFFKNTGIFLLFKKKSGVNTHHTTVSQGVKIRGESDNRAFPALHGKRRCWSEVPVLS
jgi:hypothetical protein